MGDSSWIRGVEFNDPDRENRKSFVAKGVRRRNYTGHL
jgi:hypothetical protein